MERLLSAILAVMMMLCCVGAVFATEKDTNNEAKAIDKTASEKSTEAYDSQSSGKVYFQGPDNWRGERVYCHIFQYDGDKTAFYGWQLKAERCEYEGDGRWSYDLSILDKSTQIKGGLGNDIYLLMFSDNIGNETCPIMFNKDVIGDTYKIVDTTEQTFENPENSAKTMWKGSWTKNAEKYGIPLTITQAGTIQGEFIRWYSEIEAIITNWDNHYSSYPNEESYSDQSSARDHETRLAEIKKELDRMVNDGEIRIAGSGNVCTSYTPYICTINDPWSYSGSATVKKPSSTDNTAVTVSTGGHTGTLASEYYSTSEVHTVDTSTEQPSRVVIEDISDDSTDGSVPTGESSTYIFVAFAVMLTAAGVYVLTRKRKTK